MRTILLAVVGAVSAALVGGLLGWGVWTARGRPQADTPALAIMQQLPPSTVSADPIQRRNGRVRASTDGVPRLAIVIDDIGQSLTQVDEFLALQVPLTFSILPDLPHTRGSAERILRAQHEYIIHMPMQPDSYPNQNPGPNPLLLGQGLPETQERLREYMAELPQAVGASNHMGSAYTGDTEHMALVQRVLAQHRLFFLNSKTSATPVPARIAAEGGYAYLSRDVFLDNVRDVRAIDRELRQAVYRAQRKGYAIAIGHPYGETLAALSGALSQGALRDVQLVSLTDLMR